MNICSNVTEQDLIILLRIAEQQKTQRAPKIKSKILQQTHDMKLAENLSTITKRLDEVKETTQKIGDVIKESQQETPQLATEDTPIHQPIENNEGVLCDVDLEKTLKSMENNNAGFSKTYHDPQSGWMLNNYPFKMLRGTTVEINNEKYIVYFQVFKSICWSNI